MTDQQTWFSTAITARRSRRCRFGGAEGKRNVAPNVYLLAQVIKLGILVTSVGQNTLIA